MAVPRASRRRLSTTTTLTAAPLQAATRIAVPRSRKLPDAISSLSVSESAARVFARLRRCPTPYRACRQRCSARHTRSFCLCGRMRRRAMFPIAVHRPPRMPVERVYLKRYNPHVHAACPRTNRSGVRFEKAIYVLHCYQKKSPSGIRTARTDAHLIRERLQVARADYEVRYGTKT